MSHFLKGGITVRFHPHSIYEKNREFYHLTEKDVPDLGRIILAGYMDLHERHPEFWRIFVMENLFGGKHGRPGHTRDDTPYGHLRSLYAAGQNDGIYSSDVSFETFIFVLTAISFFYTSNMKTMSDTLGSDLSDPDIKAKLMGEISLMMFDRKECHAN